MNTSNLTTLRWCDLVSKQIIGKDILVEYYAPAYGPVPDIYRRRVTVKGTAYIGQYRVLLVYDPCTDDIYIILRDGQGYLWDAYQEL